MYSALFCVVFTFGGFVNGFPFAINRTNSENSMATVSVLPVKSQTNNVKEVPFQPELDDSILKMLWPDAEESLPKKQNSELINKHGGNDNKETKYLIPRTSSADVLTIESPPPEIMINPKSDVISNKRVTNFTLEDKFLPSSLIVKVWQKNTPEEDKKAAVELPKNRNLAEISNPDQESDQLINTHDSPRNKRVTLDPGHNLSREDQINPLLKASALSNEESVISYPLSQIEIQNISRKEFHMETGNIINNNHVTPTPSNSNRTDIPCFIFVMIAILCLFFTN